jgi:parvulin-like peptidyl-prolyl isomerase
MSKTMLMCGIVAVCCGVRVRAQFTDSVVARVQNEIITAYEIYEESQRQEQVLRSRASAEELDGLLAKLRQQTAVRLIEQELVYAEFSSLGVEVPGALVQQRVDRFVKNQADGDRAKFETMLDEQGMTLKEFEEKIRRALAVELLLREKVQRNIDIGPAQVTAYYNEHRDQFDRKAQVRLQYIVIKKDGKNGGNVDETVAKVFAELAGGKPFDELARTYSDGLLADKGGDQGWRDAEDVPALKDILGKMTPGEYWKEPVKVGDSAYIILLADRRGGGLAPLDADLQERIRDLLGREEENGRYRQFIDELRRKYFVKIFDSELAAYWNTL